MKNRAFLSLALVFFLVGCGGGTSGSDGGQPVQVGGVARTLEGAPLVGAEVTLLETGETTTTLAGGEFAFAEERDLSQATILIKIGEDEAQAEPIEIAEGETAIAVEVVLGSGELGLEVVSIEVIPLSPTPAPTAPPTPTTSPIETPEPVAPTPTAEVERVDSIFSGVVLAADGTPISGVGVEVFGLARSLKLLSGKDGAISFNFKPGVSQLTFRFDYLNASDTVDLVGLPGKASRISAQFRLTEIKGEPGPDGEVNSQAKGIEAEVVGEVLMRPRG